MYRYGDKKAAVDQDEDDLDAWLRGVWLPRRYDGDAVYEAAFVNARRSWRDRLANVLEDVGIWLCGLACRLARAVRGRP